MYVVLKVVNQPHYGYIERRGTEAESRYLKYDACLVDCKCAHQLRT